eukprot:COSAG02_NODE_986_length_15452_cov_17.818602_4_plen_149_part_00
MADPTCIYLPVLDLVYIVSQLRCDGLVCVYEVDPRALRVERGCCGPLQDGRQFPHQFKLPSTRARLNLREVNENLRHVHTHTLRYESEAYARYPPPGILTQDFNTNTLRTSNSRTTEPELVSVSQDPGESITRIMPDPEAESGVAPAH